MIFRTGAMRGTDFTHEEFEGLLGSFCLTFRPLEGRGGEDADAYARLLAILNGFAERHGVRPMDQVTASPRPTEHDWGLPKACMTPDAVLDHIRSFTVDFGLCQEPGPDEEGRRALGQTILGILHRYGAIAARFDADGEGRRVAVGVRRWNGSDRYETMTAILGRTPRQGEG